MKRISSFIPVHVINKKALIKEFNYFIYDNFPNDMIGKIEAINIKDNILMIGCKNSSLATILRFEKQLYLDILSKNQICKIKDLKISIID